MWFPLQRSEEKRWIRSFSGKVKNTPPLFLLSLRRCGREVPRPQSGLHKRSCPVSWARIWAALAISPACFTWSCYSLLISFFNIFVVLVCVSFPLCSRFPPGICAILSLRNCQLISVHGNSGTVLQFGAQLSPEEPLFPFILPSI